MNKLDSQKVALVYDDLVQKGGAEELFLFLKKEVFPNATVFIPIVNFKVYPSAKEESFNLVYSPFLSFLGTKFGIWGYTLASFLSVFWLESLNLSNYSLVFSVSNRFAHVVNTPAETLHISYVTSPFRRLWTSSKKSLFSAFFLSFLRTYNFYSAKRPNYILSISKLVDNRVRKYWRINSTVIHPPLLKDFSFTGEEPTSLKKALPREYFLFVGRLLPRKNIEWLIKTLPKKYNLVVAGEGPLLNSLKKQYSPNKNVFFLGYVDDLMLPYLYKNAIALIYPHKEDFGLVPLEALYFNKPTICYYKGGFMEYLTPAVSVPFKDKKTFLKALERVKSLKIEEKEKEDILKNYSKKVFAKNLNKIIMDVYERFQKS